MKKILKKLLHLYIAVTVICSTVPCFAASVDYKGTLSDYKRTFSESTDISDYINVIGNADSGNFQSLYDYDGNMVLKFGGSEDTEPAKSYNSGGKVWTGERTERISLDFKVMSGYCNGRNYGAFCVYGEDYDVIFMMQKKEAYLLGKKVSTYEYDTWYDVSMKIDFSLGYVSLSFKKSTDDEWFTITSAASDTNNILMSNWKGISSSVTSVTFSNYRNTKNDRAVTYVDDLVINTWDNDDGAVNLIADNFDSGINTITDSSNEMTDSNIGWLVNGDVVAQGDGAAVLSVDSASEGSVYKSPFNSAPSARQRIRFKLSAPTDGGAAKACASFKNPEALKTQTPLDNAKNVPLVEISSDKVILGDAQYDISLSDDLLYDCEIVYDADLQIAKATLVDEDGIQYIGSAQMILSDVFGNDSPWGYFSEFALNISSSQDTPTVVRFDDFKWDLGLNSSAEVNLAEGQSISDATLDVSVFFIYGETVDSDKTIGIFDEQTQNATLTVLENGEEKETSYTLEWLSEGTIRCTFANLRASSNYSVTLDGVILISGERIEGNTITFDTMAKEVCASEPRFSGGTVSVDISTGYLDGKSVMLIVVEYDESDVITNVRILEKRVGLSDETLSVSSISGCSKIGVLLWENFVTQKPYIKEKFFNVN